jgi:uncharacterized membrane protein YfcA
MIDYLTANWMTLTGGSLIGFIVGILTGLFGAGGGFIITPALNIFLGLPMNLAVGTSACQVLGAAGFTFFHKFDKKMMGGFVALYIGIGVPIGVFLGTAVVDRLKGIPPIELMGREINTVNFVLLSIFAVFLLLISSWMLFDNYWLSRHKLDEDEAHHRSLIGWIKLLPKASFRTIPAGKISIPILASIGLFMGFMSGLLGIGGGVIMMPILYYIVGQQTKYAVKTSVMLILMSGLFATISHAFSHNIDYYMVIFLIAGAFFGTKVGIAIHHKISGKSLRKYFAFVVLAAAVMVIIKVALMVTGKSG